MSSKISKILVPFLYTLLSLNLALFSGSTGCSSKAINENNPEEVYKDAEDDIEGKRYLQAIDKLRAVKNKFPYSNYATKAALRIADVHFYEESFVEAAASYETFQDLHPKFERADYVLFQIEESYFLQLPDTNDRDLTAASKAIEAFQNLEKLYPNSQYITKAREHSVAALDRLASKEKYIADYYFKQKLFDSAARRYEKITKNYIGTQSEENAYMRWAECLKKMDKKDEAKHAYDIYLSRFPSGKYTKQAESAQKSL